MDDYALIDNKLAASQLDIGESSNLAQVAQTYDCTYGEQIHKDAVCILSVLAQAAIDNAKRQFDVDIGGEIRRLKKELNVKERKYPSFWTIIRSGFNKENINPDLHCPMNYMYDLKLDQFKPDTPTIDMEQFFIKHPIENDRRTCRKVEELISEYAYILEGYNIEHSKGVGDSESWYWQSRSLLMQADFDMLLKSIQKIKLSSNYAGLFSWLIDRAFVITPAMQNNVKTKSKVKKNRSLLLKVLYTMNRKQFLQCFEKYVDDPAISCTPIPEITSKTA